ncbi:MAG: hypothetical protein QOG63_494 [Thermoleophilaceae bacterium]|jgi:hypothetical protein|nr:hypothetical protein [Thermoleophilaceae bacterium]
MANTLKIPGRNSSTNPGAKLVKSTGKAVKKSAQYKAAKKAVEKTSTRAKAGVLLAVGATTAAGAVLLRRRGGDENPAQAGNADLSDPAVAAGV